MIDSFYPKKALFAVGAAGGIHLTIDYVFVSSG
jgi:hypothetical protein